MLTRRDFIELLSLAGLTALTLRGAWSGVPALDRPGPP